MKKNLHFFSRIAKTSLCLVFSLLIFSSLTLEKQSFYVTSHKEIKLKLSSEKFVNTNFYFQTQNEHESKNVFFTENELEENEEENEEIHSLKNYSNSNRSSIKTLEKILTTITKKVSAPDADFYTYNKPPFFIFYLQLKSFLA